MRNKFAKVSDPNKFVTDSGSEIHILYSPRVNVDGSIRLEKSGEVNIRDEINSHRDETDMAMILRKFQMGDQTVINVNNPMYGDFRNMPKSMAEVLQIHIDAERVFDSLPVDVRTQFGNDVNKWIAGAGSAEWLRLMRMDTIKDSEPIKEEKEIIANES